jgi:DNA polymerase III subunit epsilon
MNYVIVDIETTGGNPKQSKVTEIAMYKHNGVEIIDHYETLINPEMEIPEFICRLTGITDEMVENAPKFYEIAKKIIEFTEDCVFVAHNVSFDYNVLRYEFKGLGFDFRRPHLCTVKTARIVIPGHDSYSLGKLSRSLGIEIVGRHRAGGDALATAKLFDILIKKDTNQLKNFVQEDIKTNLLHPKLDIDLLDEIPDRSGLYYFFNEENQLIFQGKAKHIKRKINQHLKNSKTKKGAELMKGVARIEFTLTGSETIATLIETSQLKKQVPPFNTKPKFPYGIFAFENSHGYLNIQVGSMAKNNMEPILLFQSKKEASFIFERLIHRHALCQYLEDNLKDSCNSFVKGYCSGACIGKELQEDYNERAQKLIKQANLEGLSFAIIENGRQKGEKSIIIVENGRYLGFGYAPFHAQFSGLEKLKRYIDIYQEDEFTLSILHNHIQTLDERNIFYFV